MGVIANTIVYGFIKLPIGDAYCIFSQTPLIIVIIAAVFLKEKLPKMTPFIIILALIGILFLTQPTFLMLYINPQNKDIKSLDVGGLILMCIGTLARGIDCILVRSIENAHFLQFEIVVAGQLVLLFTPILLLVNHFVLQIEIIGDLDADSWIFDTRSIIIGIAYGITGFGGICLSVVGYQYGDATKVAWLEYTSIVFGYLYQILVFGDIPNLYGIIGIVLVIVACGMLLVEEYHSYQNQKNYNRDSDISHASMSDLSYIANGNDSDYSNSSDEGISV